MKDRRLFARFRASFPVRFADEPSSFGRDVYLRDAGAGGVHVVSRRALHPNDAVNLQVQLNDGYDPLVLRGRVVWVDRPQPRLWEAGVAFHRIDLVRLRRLYHRCPH